MLQLAIPQARAVIDFEQLKLAGEDDLRCAAKNVDNMDERCPYAVVNDTTIICPFCLEIMYYCSSATYTRPCQNFFSIPNRCLAIIPLRSKTCASCNGSAQNNHRDQTDEDKDEGDRTKEIWQQYKADYMTTKARLSHEQFERMYSMCEYLHQKKTVIGLDNNSTHGYDGESEKIGSYRLVKHNEKGNLDGYKNFDLALVENRNTAITVEETNIALSKMGLGLPRSKNQLEKAGGFRSTSDPRTKIVTIYYNVSRDTEYIDDDQEEQGQENHDNDDDDEEEDYDENYPDEYYEMLQNEREEENIPNKKQV